MQPKRAVVVGGGLAGLAATEALLSAGWTTTLLEPATRLGGVIDTVRRDGWLVERSADSFLTARPEAVAVVERLGLAGELIGIQPAARRALVCRRGRLHPVPAGFRLLAPGRIGSVLSSRLLSPAGRLRLLAERWVGRRPETVDDESLQSFAIRRLGRETFEWLVQPLVAGIWTADPSRLSMAASCPEFFEMERMHGSLWAGEAARLAAPRRTTEQASGARYGQFATLAGGMRELVDSLTRRISAATVQRARVRRIERLPSGGWTVDAEDAATGSAHPLFADAVVLAVPATVAAGLLAGIDAPLADALRGIEYAGSAIVSLGFAREDVAHPLDAAGVVVPRSEGRRILAASFSSSKFPGRAPDGHVLMRVFVGGALDPDVAALDDTALESLAVREVGSLLGVSGRPRLVQIDRWAGAMPQYHLGHVRRMERIEARLQAVPSLALAGSAYRGVGIPQVLLSGSQAADRVMRAASGPAPRTE